MTALQGSSKLGRWKGLDLETEQEKGQPYLRSNLYSSKYLETRRVPGFQRCSVHVCHQFTVREHSAVWISSLQFTVDSSKPGTILYSLFSCLSNKQVNSSLVIQVQTALPCPWIKERLVFCAYIVGANWDDSILWRNVWKENVEKEFLMEQSLGKQPKTKGQKSLVRYQSWNCCAWADLKHRAAEDGEQMPWGGCSL